jgi:hypothetical protein
MDVTYVKLGLRFWERRHTREASTPEEQDRTVDALKLGVSGPAAIGHVPYLGS